jgi:tripartite-type tricarboxylate transporter receptor subunit TctC
MTDLLGGQIPMMFNNLAPSVSQVKAGKLRALAVTSRAAVARGAGRADDGRRGYPGVVFMLWVGLLAPTETPVDIIAKLNAETVKAANLRDVRERLSGKALSLTLRARARWGNHS